MINHGFQSHLEPIFPRKGCIKENLVSLYDLSLFMVFFLFRMDGLCRRIYNVNESTEPMVNNDIETKHVYVFCYQRKTNRLSWNEFFMNIYWNKNFFSKFPCKSWSMIFLGFESHLEPIFPTRGCIKENLFLYMIYLCSWFSSFSEWDSLCRRIYNVNEMTGHMVNNDIETGCKYGFCYIFISIFISTWA